jgi:hypothetical protein
MREKEKYGIEREKKIEWNSGVKDIFRRQRERDGDGKRERKKRKTERQWGTEREEKHAKHFKTWMRKWNVRKRMRKKRDRGRGEREYVREEIKKGSDGTEREVGEKGNRKRQNLS